MNRAQRKCFNRINSCRSIPTSLSQLMVKLITKVSIVSIHADQSRHRNGRDGEVFTEGFNRINSCRSIPTCLKPEHLKYCTRGFNRINSCRSIPTYHMRYGRTHYHNRFQSYQFMQINPDFTSMLTGLLIRILVSIVSIHADQSRQGDG